MNIHSTTTAPANATTRAFAGRFLSIYLPLLYGVQACYALAYVHSAYLRTAVVVPTLYRLLVWTLPVVVYLAVKKDDVLDALGLRRHIIRGIIWGLILGLALLVISVVVLAVARGHVKVHLDLGANIWIGPIALVGLSEEVVFRGFLLAEFSKHLKFWTANLVQATLFLLIHIPGWILLHQFVFPQALSSIATVFGLGAFLGFLRRKTDSLWSCMILHSFNNLAFLSMH